MGCDEHHILYIYISHLILILYINNATQLCLVIFFMFSLLLQVFGMKSIENWKNRVQEEQKRKKPESHS